MAIVWLSAAPYVWKLGFYSDDWSFLAMFHFAAAQGDELRGAIHEFPGRPLAAVYQLLLFKAFGPHPLGYHLVNTAVLAGAICLLYLLLVRLTVSRAGALAAALVLAALPQLSTVRMWSAASAVNLSMLLALLSLHAQLSFYRTRATSSVVLAIVAAATSIAAYEIFAPFLAAFPIGSVAAKLRTTGDGKWKSLVPTAVAVALLGSIAVLLKVASSGRAGQLGDLARYLHGARKLVRTNYDWRTEYGLNLLADFHVFFWRPLADWGRSAGGLINGHYGAVSVVAAVAAASLAFWRLRAAGLADQEDLRPMALLVLGCITFTLGHATFLLVPAIQYSPTGVGNRLLVAAAIGVAMIVVALIGYAARATPAAYRGACTGAAVAVLVLCSVLRLATLSDFWIEAGQTQQRILHAVRADLGSVLAGSTIVLDGVCPYNGPAPVLETSWDVGGAISVTLGRRLEGDTINARTLIRSSGLQTSLYDQPSFHPFGPRLYVYNPYRHLVVPLASASDAERYFSRRNRWPVHCPPSYSGHGALID